MDIGKEFRTSPEKEAEGVKESMGDATFIIARAGNHQYNRLVNKLFTEHKRVLDMKTQEASDLSDKLMAEVMAKHVLKGWEGAVELDGVALPYSVANAQRLLEIKDFRAWVDEKARDFTKFKAAVEEDVLGN